VNAINTVQLTQHNYTSATVDLGATQIGVMVIKI